MGDLPGNWNNNGYALNAAMIDAFAEELHAQGIVETRLIGRDLFPHFAV
jgi:4,5-dihydroxyphthalate decarboxylase